MLEGSINYITLLNYTGENIKAKICCYPAMYFLTIFEWRVSGEHVLSGDTFQEILAPKCTVLPNKDVLENVDQLKQYSM